MLGYGIAYFNWLEDIREYKYFLQSLLLNVFNRNLFSCQQFETSSDLLFKTSLWLGYMNMANFLWKLKEHCLLCLLCLCMVEQFELFPTLMLVFPFFSLYFPNVTGESCAVRIVLVLKWLGAVIISLRFKLTLCKANIHFSGLECC